VHGLDAEFSAVLDRRLAPGAAAPLAVALSGGGDSLALLILTLDWAKRHDRPVLALVFDHGLNSESPAWTRFAVEAAQRLGAAARALSWAGAKPATGLPAAARLARHAALADAARQAGASVLLMGHTADDRLEAAHMRGQGTHVSDPAVWSPSPAWPQGRGIHVLRPLLNLRRAALRDFLRIRGETWLDDPANDNPRFARARARAELGPDAPPPPQASEPACADISGWREAFGALETDDAQVDARGLAAACLCAAGTDSPPEAAQLARLLAQVERPEDFTATLAGARIARRDGRLSITRETGRLPIAQIALPPGQAVVWDGRFEITTAEPGLTVRSLGGLAARLPKAQRDALDAVPAAARPSLPAVVDGNENASCPVLAGGSKGVVAASLVMARFAAACGRIAAEKPKSLAPVAKYLRASYLGMSAAEVGKSVPE